MSFSSGAVNLSEPLDPGFAGTFSGLLDAVSRLSSDLDTRSLLRRIVVAACGLTAARYGALGVVGHDGRLSDFVTFGLTDEQEARIGAPPVGRGLLAVGLHSRGPLRMSDLTEHPSSVGFPAHHPPMRTLLIAPLKVRGTDYGSLYLTEKAGGEFTDHDEAQVEALATIAGFVIENAHAYRTSERRRRWLELLAELGDIIRPPLGHEQALDHVASLLCAAADALSAWIYQIPEPGSAYVAASAGDDAGPAERAELVGAVQDAWDSGDIVQVALPGERLALLAPLRAHLTSPGVAVVVHPSRAGRDFVEEMELMRSFADQVGLTLDRTQALKDREQMAVVADRDRIARDLHDVVIQRLFALGLHMQSIRSAAADTPQLQERIDTSARELDQTIRDIRNTIFGLQRAPQTSLRSHMRDLVRECVPMLGFAPSVHLEGRVDFPIDAQVQQVLDAVVREALTNIAQHARAGSASMTLSVSESSLCLTIADNGLGLPADRQEVGLRQIRRRAALLGGTLALRANQPSGTVLVWEVSLQPPTREK